MKRIFIILCGYIFIVSCSKSSTNSSSPSSLKIKYEMIFSSPLTSYPPNVIGPGAIFRITYMDSVGMGVQTYPTLTGTSWNKDVSIVTKSRPIDLGFETTQFYLSAKGTIISNIFVNNVLWKTRTDTTTNLSTNGINYFKAALGTFYFSYVN